jgi:hypothetical protein
MKNPIDIFSRQFNQGEVYSHEELRYFLEEQPDAVLKNVTAYTYNRWNKGMPEINPLLEWVDRGKYKYLGSNFPFSGMVIHSPQGSRSYKIGEWVNGTFRYYGGYTTFKEWRKSLDDENFRVTDIGSKITIQSSDKTITQKRLLTDIKSDSPEFTGEYAHTYFKSTLGQLLFNKTISENFKFGDKTYYIRNIS